jgi:hypothetical protein
MTKATRFVPAPLLAQFAYRALAAVGLPDEDAAAVAAILFSMKPTRGPAESWFKGNRGCILMCRVAVAWPVRAAEAADHFTEPTPDSSG